MKTIFTSCQNTAKFYDKHIRLTVLFKSWPEFGLKPRYFALHLTEKFFKTSFPPYITVECTLGYKATGRRSRI